MTFVPHAPARWPYVAFRTAATVLAVLALTATSFAGAFLDGRFDMLDNHRNAALALGGTALAAAVTAVVLRRAGGAPGWLAPAAVLLLPAVLGQLALGFEGQVGFHVVLGVLIVAGTLLLLAWAWSTPLPPSRGRGRRAERGLPTEAA